MAADNAAIDPGSDVVESRQDANRPRTATNGRGHDTEAVTSMRDKLTPAQRRILDFLLADESGDFIIVPRGVCNVVGPFDRLVALGLIEQDWRPAPSPPGSFDTFYRAKRNV